MYYISYFWYTLIKYETRSPTSRQTTLTTTSERRNRDDSNPKAIIEIFKCIGGIERDCKYYQLLNNVNKYGNWEEWILYMLQAVEETSKMTIRKINLIKNALDETIAEVSERAPKLYRKELVELLYEQPYSKIEFVVERLGVERKAASRYLRQLNEIGILEPKKIGRENIYVNTKLIEILKKY